ncbi:MAG: lysozyme inhibitor LprI family protein [Pseudomonadota bacterium]
MRALILLGVLASPVAAQELVFSPTATQTCLGLAADYTTKRACVGMSARACMEDTPGGYSTVAMGGCFEAELEFWDATLNATYQSVLASAQRAGPGEVEALRNVQRAWIPFRDATCDYEYGQWGGGTGGGPAIISCLMRMTGEQALYLDFSRLGE